MRVRTAEGTVEASKCECGAITVDVDGGSFSMTSEEFDKIYPGAFSGDLPDEYGSCNHCVNHWGIGLCGCGSGEKFGECSNDYPECRVPAQDMEAGVVSCSSTSAWA
jgi:hypothetical protein